MAVLRDVLARFGIDVDTAPLKNAEKGIGDVIGKLRNMAGVLGAGVGISQLVGFVNTSADLADELNDVSARLGITTQGLQQWQYAAKLSGIETESLRGALGFLQRNLAGAADGNAEAARTFRQLGTPIKNADGSLRSLDDVMLGLSEGMQKIDDPTKRAGLAMRLFGRSGAQIVPLLSEGPEGIARLRAEFEDLGGGASAEATRAAGEYNDAMDRLNQSVFSLRMRLLTTLLPTFQAILDTTLELTKGFLKITQNSNILRVAMMMLGAAAIAFATKAAVPWIIANRAIIGQFAKTALLIAVVALTLDELITLFNGGKTVIGDFIDALFGIGSAAFFVETLKIAWDAVVYSIQEAIHAVKTFFGIESEAPAAPTGDVAARFEAAKANLLAQDDAQVARNRGQATPPTFWQGFRDRWSRVSSEGPATAPATAPAAVATTPAATRRVRTATVPATTNSRSVSNTINSPVTINMPANASRDQVAATRRVVEDVLAQRNREANASFSGEAVEQ